MRGLENMVHDASHWNWHLANHGVNDLMANALAAWPMALSVPGYRPSHIKGHHGDFGGDGDPCRRRVADSRENIRRLGRVRALLRYAAGFYKAAAARPAGVLRALAWHAVLVVTHLAAAGPEAGAAGLGCLVAAAHAGQFCRCCECRPRTTSMTTPAASEQSATASHVGRGCATP